MNTIELAAAVTAQRAADVAAGGRSCRGCGCTEHAACVSRSGTLPCAWVEIDLCSRCANEGRGLG